MYHFESLWRVVCLESTVFDSRRRVAEWFGEHFPLQIFSNWLGTPCCYRPAYILNIVHYRQCSKNEESIYTVYSILSQKRQSLDRNGKPVTCPTFWNDRSLSSTIVAAVILCFFAMVSSLLGAVLVFHLTLNVTQMCRRGEKSLQVLDFAA